MTLTNEHVSTMRWNGGFPRKHSGYPLVNIQKTMEHHHFVAGKINYFYGPFSIAILT